MYCAESLFEKSGKRGIHSPLAGCEVFLVKRAAHALSVIARATACGIRFVRRATGHIGLRSLAGSNDFGFLIAHGISSFYCLLLFRFQTEGLAFCVIAGRGILHHFAKSAYTPHQNAAVSRILHSAVKNPGLYSSEPCAMVDITLGDKRAIMPPKGMVHRKNLIMPIIFGKD